ncbi:MAG: hypothetical protein RBS39_09135 [Phycisphaerales bacterium]|jgi:hypothetical protein|nr:hypothetical protein [Phycisphaerales bacterium]
MRTRTATFLLIAPAFFLSSCGEEAKPAASAPPAQSPAFDWSGVAAVEKNAAVDTYWPLAARLDELGDRVQPNDTLRYTESGGIEVVSSGAVITSVEIDGSRVPLDPAVWKGIVVSIQGTNGSTAIRAVPGAPGTMAPRRAYILRSTPGSYDLAIEIVKKLD